ncbi:MAG: hypothetical protein ACPHO4_01175 [Longimicrobiales bacterium]
MTSRQSPPLEWVPPLLVGASAAIAAEVALSLLLYGGPGLVRSLTTVLGVEGFAFAAGLWSSPGPGRDMIDRVRRRWILGLVVFLVAATYSSVWTFVPLLGEGRLGQSAGLVIMGAAPLYAAGAMLGGMTSAAVTDEGGRLSGHGAAAAAGAALGFVLTGFMLPRVPMPGTMLVGCLVFLSVAGMIYGAVLGSRTEIFIEARRPSPIGEVRVQERRLESDGVSHVELYEGDVLRRSRDLGSAASEPPWDVAAVRALVPSLESPWRVLFLGGGASSAPRSAMREHPTAEVEVAERTAAVIELGREYFGTELSVGSVQRQAVAVGNLDDLIASLRTTYDLIIVDLDALAPIGGLRGLSHATLWRTVDAVRPEGVIAFGPGPVEPVPEHLAEWEQANVPIGNGLLTLFARGPLAESATERFSGSTSP